MKEDIIKYKEVKRVNKLLIERANKRLNEFVKGGLTNGINTRIRLFC